MASFDELRTQLQFSRAQAELARTSDVAARERYELLKARPGVSAAEVEAAKTAADNAAKEAFVKREQEINAIAAFGTVSDPDANISSFAAGIPILMFPVRIETRFQQNTPTPYLLVRIYPDDCLIETFDPLLSEDEARAARLYWETVWIAGGDASRKRSAWQQLVAASGEGRAQWMTSNVSPQFPIEMPTRTNATDIILVIVVDTPLAEREKVTKYWASVWKADGAKDAIDAARQTLISDLGGNTALADKLIASTKPANFDAKPDAPLTKKDVAVQASVLILPSLDLMTIKRHTWSSAARASLLPDRFVFIGRRQGKPDVVKLGEPVMSPLVVSPDPSLPKEKQLRHDTDGKLQFPDDMLWMVDFERAVQTGMGFRVPVGRGLDLKIEGFDRVIVAGVRLSSDELTARNELESLFVRHHYSRAGLAVVPQGTPTNNTDDGASGHSPGGDGGVEDRTDSALWKRIPGWDDRADGQWLVEYLGLEDGILTVTRNSGGYDQAEARAMNAALWPTTLAWWFTPLMAPLFDYPTIEWLRGFFTDFVSGRGPLPSLRIGNQPYGILPATAYSRSTWFRGTTDPDLVRLEKLFTFVSAIIADWRTKLLPSVSYVGKTGMSPHQMLLDILALHPGSVEHTWRLLETELALRQRLSATYTPAEVDAIIKQEKDRARALLTTLGYTAAPMPDLTDDYFVRPDVPLDGPLVDDRPPSETALIRPYAADGHSNYLEWLLSASGSHDMLRTQSGFLDPNPPAALLYKFLRRAVMLVFSDAAAKPRVLRAIKRLRAVPTARIERVLTEHFDCCAYRIDAWLTGVVRKQLVQMRGINEIGKPAVKGIYLGAYAWVENLQADPPLEPATIPSEVLPDFSDLLPLSTDSQNEGYIHAPSLNHAVTAAVLRNGYISNTDKDNPNIFAINLTSERVRIALSILEGLRGGQSLGALLGYQFERGLHDRYEKFGVDVDEFIYPLRREFPLASNHLASTKIGDDEKLAIEAIEARNVIDGLALVDYVRPPRSPEYPYIGKVDRLRKGSDDQNAAITAETKRLVEICDAVADLAISEGVHQAILGNFDRAGATLDSLSKGYFPPEPQIVRTPIEGTGLTHRVGVHLKPGLSPDFSPISGVAATPRSMAEPAVNEWIAALLPPLDEIACVVKYRDGRNTPQQQPVKVSELGLQPVDILRLAGEARQQSASELDERITARVAQKARPDAPVVLAYMEKGTARLSLFEALPLIQHLQRLTRVARPLAATDLSRPNDAKSGQDDNANVDRQRIVKPLDLLRDPNTGLRAALMAFAAQLAALLPEAGPRRTEIVASCDEWIDTKLPSLFGRAALFGIPQSGWSFAYEFRKSIFVAVRAQAAEVVDRWTRKLTEHKALLAQESAMPASTPAGERFAVLTRAEAAITTSVTAPLPATPADYRTLVEGKGTSFEARMKAFAALGDSAALQVKVLLDDFKKLLPVTQFDLTELSTESAIDRCVLFAEDLLRVVKVLVADADKRIAATEKLLVQHGAAATSSARVSALTDAAKALLGDDFTVIPELTLDPAQGRELTAAYTGSASLLDHLVNTVKLELPVDSWLYGVARVRERMRDWEQVVLFTGAFGKAEPELTPLQLPFATGDSWMALDVPEDRPLADRLLYTAHFREAFDASKRQCGLLLDEWTEVIPGAQTTTGVALHYDRPNNEAPQAMLLLTSPRITGMWEWRDVVDALSETLDLAKIRAIEPRHLDLTAYSQYLPAAEWMETFQ